MASDDEKRAKYQRVLAEYDAEQQAQREEASHLFDIDEFIIGANAVQEAMVPTKVGLELSRLREQNLSAGGLSEEDAARLDAIVASRQPTFFVVRYKKLTNADTLQLAKITDKDERGLEMLFLMLSKADSKVTKAKVKQMGSVVTARILAEIMSEESVFLSRITPSIP